MNSSINYQIINNLHKELNKSLNHLFKSRFNCKIKRNKNYSNNKKIKNIKDNIIFNKENINGNDNDKSIKYRNETSFIMNKYPFTERVILSNQYNLFNNQSNSYINENYNSLSYKKNFSQISIKKRMSNTKYLFDNYSFSDISIKEIPKRNYSTLNKIIQTNENKSLNNINTNKKNRKIFQLKKNSNNLEISLNQKSDDTKSNISELVITNPINIHNNINNNNKKINLILNENKKGISSKKKPSFNNINIKSIKKRNNINNIKNINNTNNNNKIILKSKKINKKNIEKISIKEREDLKNSNSKEEESLNKKNNINQNEENILKSENNKINILSKINIDSIMGTGDNEIKNVNQDSLFVITNNKLLSIFKNKIPTHNLFIEQNNNKNNKNQNINNIYTFLGICDGHGDQGQTISNYINNTIPLKIKHCLNKISYNITEDNFKKEIIPNIKLIFNKVNTILNSMQSIETIYSGSCFCSLIITPSSIISINLGNSRAIIGVEKTENEKKIFFPYNLTFEHTPLIEEEKERIIENGGDIFCEKDEYNREFGPLKIWKKNCLLPGLLTTRSLGDKEGRLIGVISEPELQYFEMKNDYKFVVIGSKGLWDVISNEECVKLIGIFYLKNDIHGAVNQIINIAKSRWIEEHEEIFEDISIIIGFIKEVKF